MGNIILSALQASKRYSGMMRRLLSSQTNIIMFYTIFHMYCNAKQMEVNGQEPIQSHSTVNTIWKRSPWYISFVYTS